MKRGLKHAASPNLLTFGLGLGLVFCLSCSTNPKPAHRPPPTRLVLGLDGVSYALFKKVQQGGYFRDFQPVVPMVATFPSISDPNWARIFKTPISQGYTKSHFDETAHSDAGKGQIIGGLIDHLRSPTEYEKLFDFKAEGFWQHVATMTWISTSALYWLDAVEEQFFATSGKDTFFAFIMNTDLISHIEGEKALMKYLVTVDIRLENMRKRYRKQFGGDFEIVLVSDHGNSYAPPTMIQFQDVLQKRNWNFTQSLAKSRDVVFVAPEILSFGAFYCAPSVATELARDFSFISGVDIAIAESKPNVIELFQNQGKNHSRLEVDPTEKLMRYSIVSGQDPLNQISLLKSAGGLPMSFEKYFQLTADHDYPNALARIWEGFHVNATLPAQVLVSTQNGFAFSNPTLELITTLKGLRSLHGSLRKEESQGIFISTRNNLPVIRPQDFSEVISIQDFGRAP